MKSWHVVMFVVGVGLILYFFSKKTINGTVSVNSADITVTSDAKPQPDSGVKIPPGQDGGGMLESDFVTAQGAKFGTVAYNAEMA